MSENGNGGEDRRVVCRNLGKNILFDSKDKALRNLVSELRKTLEGTGLEIRNKRFAGYYLKGE